MLLNYEVRMVMSPICCDTHAYIGCGCEVGEGRLTQENCHQRIPATLAIDSSIPRHYMAKLPRINPFDIHNSSEFLSIDAAIELSASCFCKMFCVVEIYVLLLVALIIGILLGFLLAEDISLKHAHVDLRITNALDRIYCAEKCFFSPWHVEQVT